MEYKIYQIDEIKEMLLPIFEAAPIYRAILFGSYAKGKATEESDIDIVVDCMGGIINVSYFSLLADITTLLKKRVDLFEISEFSRHAATLSTLEREGIVLYEKQG